LPYSARRLSPMLPNCAPNNNRSEPCKMPLPL
jgi:hypothetical protein